MSTCRLVLLAAVLTAWSLPAPAFAASPQLPDPPVVINEVLADPASDAAGDANGDGIRDTYQDEFIELVNRSLEPVDIGGWLLGPAGALPDTIPAGTLLPPGGYWTLFGGGTPTRLPGPAGTADGRLGSGLSNTAGRILLIRPAGPDTLQDISYTDWDTDASFVRSPEGEGAFIDHTLAAPDGSAFSPSAPARPGGGPFTGSPPVYRVRVVNPTSTGFGAAWRTGEAAPGRLEVTAEGWTRHIYDPRPGGLLHLADRYGLSTGSQAAWRVVSAGTMVPADSLRTQEMGTVSPTVPYTVYGVLAGPEGAAADAHVFLRSRSGDGSAWLAAVTDSLGNWNLNLGNLRKEEGAAAAWSPGDTLEVEGDGAAAGVSEGLFVVSGTSPQEIPLPLLAPNPPPVFHWTSTLPARADTALVLGYELLDDGEVTGSLEFVAETGARCPAPSDPPMIGKGSGEVTVDVSGLAEGTLWQVAARVEDGLNPPQEHITPGAVRIAHTTAVRKPLPAGVLLMTPTLDDPGLDSAWDWLGRLPDAGELARWDGATGAWVSAVRDPAGSLSGEDFPLGPGTGFALVSAAAGTLEVSGPRRYAPALRELTPGLALAGIADSLAERTAEEVLQLSGVRAVSRWDPLQQAWAGRFRIPGGGTAGASFPISWGEAVAVESDSVVSWQPSPPRPAAPSLLARPSWPAGAASRGTVLRALGGAGSLELVWHAGPGGSVRITGPGGGAVWSGPAAAGTWERERLAGLPAGPYRVTLESGEAEGVRRWQQQVEVAPPSLPPLPRWLWGPAPGQQVPLVLHTPGRRVFASDDGTGRWYAASPGPGPFVLEAVLPDGGWVRWDLGEDPADGGLRPVGEPLALSGLDVEEAPRSMELRWQVLACEGPLSFQPFLASPGEGTGGPPDDGRTWRPAGEELTWRTGELPLLYSRVPTGPDVRGALPVAAAVRVRTAGGRSAWIGPVSLTLEPEAPGVELLPAVPNPFNPSTRVRFRLPPGPDREVRLDVLDTRGRRVRRLLDARLAAGTYEQVWDGRERSGRTSAAGIYLVVLQVEGHRYTRKVLLLK
ncbi:MAG: lamin tail domain-containing protein [bacterium]